MSKEEQTQSENMASTDETEQEINALNLAADSSCNECSCAQYRRETLNSVVCQCGHGYKSHIR